MVKNIGKWILLCIFIIVLFVNNATADVSFTYEDVNRGIRVNGSFSSIEQAERFLENVGVSSSKTGCETINDRVQTKESTQIEKMRNRFIKGEDDYFYENVFVIVVLVFIGILIFGFPEYRCK